jgi:hypothetical protein
MDSGVRAVFYQIVFILGRGNQADECPGNELEASISDNPKDL